MMTRNLFLGTALAVTSLISVAADTSNAKVSVAPGDQPIFVKQSLEGGLKLEAKFDAGSDLTGWIMSVAPGNNIAVYSTKDGQRGMVGTLLDSRGANLTADHLEKYGSKIDYDGQWAKVEKSAFVKEGAKGKAIKRTVYVFKDPNCSYCHQAWKTFENYYDKGLEVRWIPVAFLARDSANKAAALLEASNGEALIQQMQGEWGVRESSFSNYPISPESKKKLVENEKLMKELGFQGTPALVYKDAKGKVRVLPSAPQPAEVEKILQGN